MRGLEKNTDEAARLTRPKCRIPYRLDLAGGWLDQPFVSQHAAGPVINLSLEPVTEFNERSGMASSSRRCAINLWRAEIPSGDAVMLAKTLFHCENPNGSGGAAGSQDALGLVLPALKRLDYCGQAWPEKITIVQDEKILCWLERHLSLIPLAPRAARFEVCAETRVTPARVRRLAAAAETCWVAIQGGDLKEFGRQMTDSFEAQVAMFPGMVNPPIQAIIQQYAAAALGWKLSGAGGGGYLVLVSELEIPHAVRLKIRRANL